MNRPSRRRYERKISLRPLAGSLTSARALIIAHDEGTCLELERVMPRGIDARSVRTASDTEGLGAEVVVIGGPFPLAELAEVRAHPQLGDKPVVLFAPNKQLPEMDWLSLNVRPVIDVEGSVAQLVAHLDQLLGPGRPAALESKFPDLPAT